MTGRTAITMPKTLLKEVTLRARKAGVSRSRFIANSVEAQLRQADKDEMLRQINKAYASETQADRHARKAFQRQMSKQVEGTW